MKFNVYNNELIIEGEYQTFTFDKGVNLILIEPLKFTIDKDYFKEKFRKVLYERHMDIDEEDLLNDLMKCF